MRNKRAAFTLVELLVVLIIIAMLVALLQPTDRGSSREHLRQSKCQNNLKQIGLALLTYANEHGTLPPAYTTDADGKPLHSWRTLILPYLEEATLFKKIDLTKPWDDPVNAAAAKAIVPVFECPSAAVERPRTTYFAVVTPNSCLRADSPRRLSDIKDKSKAILVIEVDADHAVPWVQPVDADEQLFFATTQSERHSHPGIFHAVFADGHVEAISTETPPEELREMLGIPSTNQAEAVEAK